LADRIQLRRGQIAILNVSHQLAGVRRLNSIATGYNQISGNFGARKYHIPER
jgi:hypothetical protein